MIDQIRWPVKLQTYYSINLYACQLNHNIKHKKKKKNISFQSLPSMIFLSVIFLSYKDKTNTLFIGNKNRATSTAAKVSDYVVSLQSS